MLLHPLRIILSVNRLSSDFSIKTVALILDAHRVLANVPILEMKMAVKIRKMKKVLKSLARAEPIVKSKPKNSVQNRTGARPQ